MSTSEKFYPVASPDLGELEERFVVQALRSGWVSSIGDFIDQFEQGFAAYCDTRHAVAMSNGTDALFIALKAMDVGKGDEVIVPALTFAAVAAVVVHLGATPVIVDVDPKYWCLDPIAVERAITSATKAIIAVHSYGHPADVDPLLELTRRHELRLLEDCAEAHGATYKGRRVGSLADVGIFSFYGNKILTTGEGGMAVTNDPDLTNRMRYLKDHAMDPTRRYYHTEAGHNCRITNLQAALGCAQLQRIDDLQAKRNAIAGWYAKELQGTQEISLNPAMSWARPVNWMICGVLSHEAAFRRDSILRRLKACGVDTRPFFLPLQAMPPYAQCRVVGRDGDGTPVAETLSQVGFNLPSSSTLTREDVAQICRALTAIVDTND
jgi:perosamine synthetase